MLERAQALWEPSHYHFELYKPFEKLSLGQAKDDLGYHGSIPQTAAEQLEN